VLACKYRGMMKAKVIVMPKAAVLDPQGNAVRDAMRHLGMPEVRSVRIGKYMEIDLLSNPVIEDYELQNTDRGNNKKTSDSDKSRAGVQRPKSKTKRKRKSS